MHDDACPQLRNAGFVCCCSPATVAASWLVEAKSCRERAKEYRASGDHLTAGVLEKDEAALIRMAYQYEAI